MMEVLGGTRRKGGKGGKEVLFEDGDVGSADVSQIIYTRTGIKFYIGIVFSTPHGSTSMCKLLGGG